MTLQIADRVWDLTSTGGTGAFSLNNNPPTAYQSFGAVCANNDVIYYCAASRSTNEWEVGLGTFQTGPTLARTTVFSSSNGGSLVNFTAGIIKDVMGVFPAKKIQSLAPVVTSLRSSAAATVTVSAVTDYFLALDPTSNTITVNLPASPGTGLSFLIKDATGQAGTHNITVVPAAGNIDGASTFVLNANFQSVALTYNGTQWSTN